MPLHLLYSDDFTGYASQSAFELAYPYDPPTDNSSSILPNPNDPSPYAVWGLTRGPGGVPGVQNVTATEATDPFSEGPFAVDVDKVDLAPQCRLFRVKGTWDFATFSPTHSQNTSSSLLDVWSYESGNRLGSFDGNLVVVGRHHTTGTMFIAITTTPAFANIATLPGATKGFYSADVPGSLITLGGSYIVQIDGKRSELTETAPGSGIYTPSTDGFIRVSVTGTELLSFDGPVWHGNKLTNRTWNAITWVSAGKFTDLQIYDEIGCEPTQPPPCVCVPPPTSPPKLPPPIPPRPPKTPPVIGMQLACLGGGLVPTQPDLVYVENWWGL